MHGSEGVHEHLYLPSACTAVKGSNDTCIYRLAVKEFNITCIYRLAVKELNNTCIYRLAVKEFNDTCINFRSSTPVFTVCMRGSEWVQQHLYLPSVSILPNWVCISATVMTLSWFSSWKRKSDDRYSWFSSAGACCRNSCSVTAMFSEITHKQTRV